MQALLTEVTEIGTLLGFPTDTMTVERAGEIGKLAEMCGTEYRPEASWLDPVQLQHVRQMLTKLRPEYEAHNHIKQDLLTRFDDSLFELDIDRLLEHFGSVLYRAPLRWFHPGYYKDKKIIRRTTRTNALHASFTDDLLQAREVLRMHKRLEPGRIEAKALLERYDREYATDFERASRAAEVAAEVLRLAGGSSIPAGLVNVIAFGTLSPPQIPAAGQRILDAVRQWEKCASRLASIIAVDDLKQATKVVALRRRLETGREQVKALLGKYDNGYETDFDAVERALTLAADVIRLSGQGPVPAGLVRLMTHPTPVASDLAAVGARILNTVHEWEAVACGVQRFMPAVLPGTSVPLVQSSLADVAQWTQSLLPPLTELCELIEVVLASHKHPGAADVGVLYDALQQHEALLALQSHMQSEAERLRSAFGERFCGMDTAWTDILAALTWTQSMREICGQRPMSERLVQWATRTGEHTPPVQELVAHHAHFEEQWSVLEAGFEAPEPTFRGTPLKALSLAA